ncbi:MAG: signal peptidase I [Bacteroidetes bacterium]|nr:signal peptidase I [Bacteroidota bacterium]MBT4398958.1 signal peptidase I [Bacteroidota bacterium]MBT4409611.1 signal peptidase I [Bacteroidota bacterium]MBT5427732.1 signal peptidase I [Bacteroidota bacterium]MBT7095180.1 signal peptidase I [Bacteroidota bacterium]
MKSRAIGISMVPQIFPGDSITLEPALSEPEPGDILVYKALDKLVVHRLLTLKGKQNEILILKGDNNPLADSPVCKDRIIGRVTDIKPGIRRAIYLLISPALRRFQKLLSR